MNLFVAADDARPWRYRVYGLVVLSNRPIPGFLPETSMAPVDTRVWLNDDLETLAGIMSQTQVMSSVSLRLDPEGKPLLTVWSIAGGTYYRLRYQPDIQFVVDRGGNQLWVTFPPNPDAERLATLFLQGSMLRSILRLRGNAVFHASAIAVGDRALALAGPSGAGKSTLALAFCRLGYAVLSDDIVALQNVDGVFVVQPGYPGARLWPDAALALDHSPETLPLLMPGTSKRLLDGTQSACAFEQRPLPLGAIYLLGDRTGEYPKAEPISTGAGLFRLLVDAPDFFPVTKAHLGVFDLLGRLVCQVPVRQIATSIDLANLSQLCEVILQDFHRVTSDADRALT